MNHTIESCAVILDVGKIKIVIVGVYRPHTDDIFNFSNTLEIMLMSSNISGCTVFLCGDLNINLANLRCENIVHFKSLLHSLHFIPLITKPTRFSPIDNIEPTILDHIWTNNIYPCKPGIILFDVSDHCPTFFHASLPSYTKSSASELHKIVFRPFNENRLEKLKSDLCDTNWDILLENIDINLACSNFSEYLDKLYCKNFPLQQKIISNKRLNNPWITTPVKRLINLKSDYYKMFRAGQITKQQNIQLKTG